MEGQLPPEVKLRIKRQKAVERTRQWRRDNPQGNKKIQKAYYQRHKEDAIEKARIYREEHPGRYKASIARALHNKPWYFMWTSAKQKCQNPKHKHFYKNGARKITFHLTHADMRFLWQRDKGAEMKHPSLTRIGPRKPYTRDNCKIRERWPTSLAAKIDRIMDEPEE